MVVRQDPEHNIFAVLVTVSCIQGTELTHWQKKKKRPHPSQVEAEMKTKSMLQSEHADSLSESLQVDNKV